MVCESSSDARIVTCVRENSGVVSMHEIPQVADIQPGNIRLRIMTGFIALVVTATGAAWHAGAQVVVQAAGAREEVHVVSLRAQRDMGVVKQGFDYSCGAAALATLLTYGLNDPVGEGALLRALLEPLSPDQLTALQKNGLSLLDLQRLAQSRGHKAQGFRIHRDQLVKLSYPVIVFIRPHGYRHFAVFKGVRGDRVYLADPSLGNVRMPLYRFLDMWADKAGQGVIFAVERTDGSWPDHFALRLPGETVPPMEVLSAAKMRDIGILVLPLSPEGGPN
jgi:predicted double-glycine peptidase